MSKADSQEGPKPNVAIEDEIARIVVRYAVGAVVFTVVTAIAGPIVGAIAAAATGGSEA